MNADRAVCSTRYWPDLSGLLVELLRLLCADLCWVKVQVVLHLRGSWFARFQYPLSAHVSELQSSVSNLRDDDKLEKPASKGLLWVHPGEESQSNVRLAVDLKRAVS